MTLKDKITVQLENLKAQKSFDFNHLQDWLKTNIYLIEIVKDKIEKCCKICQELENLDLPFNCLQNPGYCTRKTIYFKFINIYQNTEEKINAIQN